MEPLPKHQTFWKRYLASLLDGIVFLPLAFLSSYYEGSENAGAFILFTMLHVILLTAYQVIGHGRYGQTLGKYLTGIKVLDVAEEGVIGYKKAFLRECIWFFAQMAGIVYLMVDTTRSAEPVAVHETFYKSIAGVITLSWLMVEVLTMLFNKKRRAMHDLIAGSVVVNLFELRRENLYKKQQALMASLQTR